jgi:hypothetical protein
MAITTSFFGKDTTKKCNGPNANGLTLLINSGNVLS